MHNRVTWLDALQLGSPVGIRGITLSSVSIAEAQVMRLTPTLFVVDQKESDGSTVTRRYWRGTGYEKGGLTRLVMPPVIKDENTEGCAE